MRIVTAVLITLLSASVYGATSAHLVVTQSVQKQYLHDPVYLSSTVFNKGPDTAVGTVMTIFVGEPETAFGVHPPVSVVSAPGCAFVDRWLECSAGDLAPGQQRTFVLTLAVGAATYDFFRAGFDNRAFAVSQTPDSEPPSENSAWTPIVLYLGPGVQLVLRQFDDPVFRLFAGEPTPFYVGVASVDPLPPYAIRLVAEHGTIAVHPGRDIGACSGGPTEIRCTSASASPSRAILPVDVVADFTGPVSLTASLVYDGGAKTVTQSLQWEVWIKCPTSLATSGPPDGATGLPLTGSITWKTDHPPEYQTIYLGPAGSGCTTPFAVTPLPPTVDYLLEPNTAYEWRIETFTSGCYEASSACQTFTTGNDCMVMPALIEPLGGESPTSPVTFRWAEVPAATNYHVLTASGDGPFLHRATTTATSTVITLPPGHTRWYIAADVAGCTDVRSATASFEVTAPKKRRSAR
jgi:hypothetical protein